MTMNQRNGNRVRNGVTVSEFALLAPLLFLLSFAAVEFCRVAMIRHTADNAVYEGCRIGMLPGTTSSEVEAEARRILSAVGVTNVTVSVVPSTIELDTRDVQVKVEVPLDENSIVPNQFVAGKSIVRQLTMRREGQ